MVFVMRTETLHRLLGNQYYLTCMLRDVGSSNTREYGHLLQNTVAGEFRATDIIIIIAYSKFNFYETKLQCEVEGVSYILAEVEFS